MPLSKDLGRQLRCGLTAAFVVVSFAVPRGAERVAPAPGPQGEDEGVVAAPPDDEGPSDFAGVYLCGGANADGEAYSAIVTITPYGDAYRMEWRFRSGEPGAVGMAIRDGDSLAVMFVARSAGVAMYRRQEDGTLVGRWTLSSAEGAVFTETLSRIAGVVPGLPERSDEPRVPRKAVRRVDARLEPPSSPGAPTRLRPPSPVAS